MGLLSTSNVVYDAMYDLISNNANAIGSIIIGILTGVISSVIVTRNYRMKDDEREKIVFLKELYLFSARASVRISTSLLQREETMTIEQVQDFLNECPICYSWIKFRNDEIDIVKNVYQESQNILADIATAEDFERRSRSDTFGLGDREKYKKAAEKIEKKIGERLKALINNTEKLQKILEKYEKFNIFLEKNDSQ